MAEFIVSDTPDVHDPILEKLGRRAMVAKKLAQPKLPEKVFDKVPETIAEVSPPVEELAEITPALSPQTLLEMECGRKTLEKYK